MSYIPLYEYDIFYCDVFSDVGEDKENCVPDQFQAEEGIDLTQQPELTAPSTEEFDLEEAYRKSLDEEVGEMERYLPGS